jgi:hypothetical protein
MTPRGRTRTSEAEVQAQQVLEFWAFDEPDSVVEREASAVVAEPSCGNEDGVIRAFHASRRSARERRWPVRAATR